MVLSHMPLPVGLQEQVVGRPGFEPGEPMATDLQPAPLPNTVYRPMQRFELWSNPEAPLARLKPEMIEIEEIIK